MANSQKTRQPNGAPPIFQGKDGRWHGYVTAGVKDDGRLDCRHVRRKSRADATKAVRDLGQLCKVTADALPRFVDQLRRSARSRAAA